MILEGMTLKEIIILIGIWFSNPFVPDFGTQFITAFAIGMALPKQIVTPLNNLVLKVPYVEKFENYLNGHERFRTVIPRIFAGYAVTYAIGWSLLFIGYFLL